MHILSLSMKEKQTCAQYHYFLLSKSPKKVKNPVKWRKFIQSIWKFQMHIFRWQVISVQIFRKIYAPEWTKSCPQMGVRLTDGQTDGHTDRRTGWNQYTPQTLCVGGGYKTLTPIWKFNPRANETRGPWATSLTWENSSNH